MGILRCDGMGSQPGRESPERAGLGRCYRLELGSFVGWVVLGEARADESSTRWSLMSFETPMLHSMSGDRTGLGRVGVFVPAWPDLGAPDRADTAGSLNVFRGEKKEQATRDGSPGGGVLAGGGREVLRTGKVTRATAVGIKEECWMLGPGNR